LTARRSFCLAAASVAAAPSLAFSQGAFPERPITLICPWTPGGNTDIALRALAEAASRHFGRRVIIENKPGAGGVLGAVSIATNAKPDGYTLAQIPISVFRYPHMQRTTFNSLTDLTWVICIAGYLFGTCVRADSPWKTWRDLIAFAKANPGKLAYASPGVGTSLHLTMDDIARREGIDWLQVPYKGHPDMIAALKGGEVQVYASTPPWELVESGFARVLATWGENRSPRSPDAPTLKELGYGIVSNSPWGIAGPKGLPPAIARSIHDAFRAAMQDAAYLSTLQRLGMEPFYMTGDDYFRWAVKAEAYEKAAVERLGLAKK
jgi:tripartite-type tricarboxylate transporter receptor subunit TctC